jgi:hypothetical protein
MPTDESMVEDETAPYVIFSLTVISEDRIEKLVSLPGRKDTGRRIDDHLYKVAQESFYELQTEARAIRLNAAIMKAIDVLYATGVDPALFHSAGVWVRAYFTFDPGSQTIDAESLSRLAAINATVWIDAVDPR